MPGWLAVQLCEQSLKCAYVERSGDRPALKWVRDMAFDGTACVTLGHLRRNLLPARYRCNTYIARDAYQTFEVPAPKVDQAEWRDALRWVIKDGLEFPVEQAMIETLPIPNDGAPPGREAMTFVIAARRDVVTQLVQWFQRGEMRLDLISTGNIAQRNIAALFETPGRALAFIGIYSKAIAITFTCNGAIYAARNVGWSAALLRDDAEPDARAQHFERVVLDVQRALDNFERQFSHVALQRVLLCVPAGHTELVAMLQRSLSQTVDVADLREHMDLSACPHLSDPTAQANYMQLIGMGLHSGATA